MKMKTGLIILAGMLGGCAWARDFYVAPSGNDSNRGTKENPYATLERAKQAVREYKKNTGRPDGGVTVWIRGGDYYFSKSLEFTGQDSGRKGAPVVYRAWPGEKVRLRGGLDIDPAAVKLVTDQKILDRIVEKDVRTHLRQIDLKAQGITNYGTLSARGFRRPYVSPGLEFFINGKAQQLARWPDNGFVPIGKVLDPGSIHRRLVPTDTIAEFENRGGTFLYNYDRAEKWKLADDLYLSGNWAAPFADDTIKVAEINLEAKSIRLAYSHLYGIKSGPVYCNYFALNLLEEISVPGEYYLDRTSGILYFYPPDEMNRAEISVSLLEEPLLVLEGASYVHFENLTIEITRGIGVYMEEGEGNLIAGCTLRNIGQVAVVMGRGIKPDTINRHQFTGEPVGRALGSWHEHIYENSTYNRQAGKAHGVLSCDIYNIGAGAISMGGGDRITLEPGSNFVENCRIYNYNRNERSYKAAVNVDGVGNRIAHNHIFDAPDMAVYLHGNDHVIEYNHIHHVMLESGEGGWFYMGRDQSELGNVIRYNFVHHVGVLDDGSEGNRTEGSCGIYLDDAACGTKIYQNVFYKTGKQRAATVINGGSDNAIENNIFIDCRYALYASSLFKGWAKNNLARFKPGGLYRNRLEAVNYRQPPYSVRYPQLAGYMDDLTPEQPKRNLMARNVYVNCGKIYRWNLDPQVTLTNNLETIDDPGFVNAAALNFQLKDDSAVYSKIPEFQRIPFEQIGLYTNCYRPAIQPVSYNRGSVVKRAEAGLAASVAPAKLLRVNNDGTVEVILDVKDTQSGEMHGIATLDGYLFDVRWADGELSQLVIHSKKKGTLKIKYRDVGTELKTEPEDKYGLDKNLKDVWF